jgi:hypothetical protein
MALANHLGVLPTLSVRLQNTLKLVRGVINRINQRDSINTIRVTAARNENMFKFVDSSEPSVSTLNLAAITMTATKEMWVSTYIS